MNKKTLMIQKFYRINIKTHNLLNFNKFFHRLKEQLILDTLQIIANKNYHKII